MKQHQTKSEKKDDEKRSRFFTNQLIGTDIRTNHDKDFDCGDGSDVDIIQ